MDRYLSDTSRSPAARSFHIRSDQQRVAIAITVDQNIFPSEDSDDGTWQPATGSTNQYIANLLISLAGELLHAPAATKLPQSRIPLPL